ncbi:MAG TPA: 16S rRNA (guanine(527)-N(7))-methyltransferase RsmG [Dehalococcoidia bacterium]|nr:16S rRNA (guanine(527)-N(7))-methyltransferase RsmG [Dehalococcoidia bacterium]
MGCQRADPPGDLALLAAGAEAVGLALDDAALDRFRRYLALLVEHGARMNLTSVRDTAGIQRRHFVESLAFGAALRDAGLLQGRERVVDVGAGAGFPGVPLTIVWPRLRLTLLEATKKKARFLEHVLHELALPNAAVVAARAEDAAHESRLRECFDLVLARAVAPLPALAELTLPFSRIGGRLATVKGSRLRHELAAAGAAIARCGGGAARTLPLPGVGVESPLRVIVVAKLRPTPAALPRRAGLPQSQPLR